MWTHYECDLVSTLAFLAALVVFQSTAPGYYYRDARLSEALFEAAVSGRHRAVRSGQPSPQKPKFIIAANGYTAFGEPLIHLESRIPYKPAQDSIFIIDGVTHLVEPQVVRDAETSVASFRTQLYQSTVLISTDWRLRSVGRHTFHMRVPAAPPLLDFYYSPGEFYVDVNPSGGLYGACITDRTLNGDREMDVIFQISYLDVEPPERGQISAGGILWGEARAIPSQTWLSRASGLWTGTYRMTVSTASWFDVHARQVQARIAGDKFPTILRAPGVADAFMDIGYGEFGNPDQFYPRCPDL